MTEKHHSGPLVLGKRRSSHSTELEVKRKTTSGPLALVANTAEHEQREKEKNDAARLIINSRTRRMAESEVDMYDKTPEELDQMRERQRANLELVNEEKRNRIVRMRDERDFIRHLLFTTDDEFRYHHLLQALETLIIRVDGKWLNPDTIEWMRFAALPMHADVLSWTQKMDVAHALDDRGFAEQLNIAITELPYPHSNERAREEQKYVKRKHVCKKRVMETFLFCMMVTESDDFNQYVLNDAPSWDRSSLVQFIETGSSVGRTPGTATIPRKFFSVRELMTRLKDGLSVTWEQVRREPRPKTTSAAERAAERNARIRNKGLEVAKMPPFAEPDRNGQLPRVQDLTSTMTTVVTHFWANYKFVVNYLYPNADAVGGHVTGVDTGAERLVREQMDEELRALETAML